MSAPNQKHYYLDFCGLLSIGIFSLGYIVFVRRFAEQHIQFSFLDFPIFVGEILLFICLLLFLVKYRNNIQKFTKWHYLFTFSKTFGKSLLGLFSRKKRSLSWAFLMSWEGKRAIIICYFIFVILKALSGYLIWGPLALRHAALLYYPAFAVFGYAFFRKDFFSDGKALILFLLICVLFVGRHSDWWVLTLMLLGFILIIDLCTTNDKKKSESKGRYTDYTNIGKEKVSKFYPNRILRYFMFLTLLGIIPYKEFFQAARMMIVGNFLSGLYLAGTLPLILEVKKKFKIALMTLIGGVVILGLFKFADQGAVKSIVAFKKMAEVIRSCDADIAANIGRFKKEERKAVKLYNPEKPVKKESSAERKQTQEKEKNVEEEKRAIESIIDRRSAVEKLNLFLEPMKAEAAQVQDKTRHNDVEEEPIKKEIPRVEKDIKKRDVGDMRRYIESPPVVVVGKIQKPPQKPIKAEAAQVQDKTGGKDAEEVRTKIRQILRAAVAKAVGDKKLPVDLIPKPSAEPVKAEAVPVQDKTVIAKPLADPIKREASLVQQVQADPQRQNTQEEKVITRQDTAWADNSNAVFRLLIWRDMLADLAKEKPILGFDFGKPFRSRSLEMLNWGYGDWFRDGWIAAHNSYLEIIYRTGIVGILLILSLWIILFKMIRKFILTRSLPGVLLCGIIINWFVAANFLLIFELPYTAIPIWTLYGMTLASANVLRET